MGITIHYRGSIDDMALIDQFEDRVLDLAFAVGGKATIWRSYANHDPARIVRGLLLDIAPGQETVSLLISPEGQLINMFEIEAAESGPLDPPSSCFVKTQFGGIEAHVTLAHLLGAIKQHYFSNLNVDDESGYFENRDIKALQEKLNQTAKMLEQIAEDVSRYGLSAEAAEDPEIVCARLERIAALVDKKFRTDGNGDEVTSAAIVDLPSVGAPTLEDEVAYYESLERNLRLRNELIQRKVSEGLSAGLSTKEVLENAIRDADRKTEPFVEPLDSDLGEIEEFLLKSLTSEENEFLEPNEFDRSRAEKATSRGSLLAELMLEKLFELGEALQQSGEHPDLLGWMEQAGSHLMDVVGGLAQVDCAMLETLKQAKREDIQRKYAMAIVQLKRALRAHSFARGAICAMHQHSGIDPGLIASFQDSLDGILEDIHQQLERTWGCRDE